MFFNYMYLYSALWSSFCLFDTFPISILNFIILLLQSNVNSSTLEKKQRQFDRTIQEWTLKVKELQTEIDTAHTEARGYSAELFRVKAQYEETSDTIEALRRENKNLAGKLDKCRSILIFKIIDLMLVNLS